MASAGTLRITAVVDDKATAPLRQINQALGGLRSGTASAGGGALGMAQALTGLGTGAAGAAVAVGAAVAGVVALAGASVKAAATAEGHRMALVRLVGDAATAEATFRRLQDFADWSPFDDDAVMRSAQRLLGAGVAVDDLVRVMTALSDASGDSGETFQRASLAYAQMALKGRVSLEELNQLAEAGIPAQALLAEAMGVTSAAVAELATKGQLAASTTLPKLVDAIGNRFGGATERAASSVNGLTSTVGAGMARALATLGTALEPLTKDVLRGLIELLKDVTAGIEALVATDEFASFADGAREAWAGLMALWRAVGPIILEVARVFMAVLGPALRVAGMALQLLAAAVSALGRVLKPVWDALRAIASVVKAVVEALAPFAARVSQAAKQARDAIDAFRDWIGSGGALRDILDAIRAAVLAVLAAIAQLVEWQQRVVDWMTDVAAGGDRAKAAFGGVAAAVHAAVEALAGLDGKRATAVVEVDDRTAEPVAAIQSSIDGIAGRDVEVGVIDVGDFARTAIQVAIDAIAQTAPVAIMIWDLATDAIRAIQSAIDGLSDRTVTITTVERRIIEEARVSAPAAPAAQSAPAAQAGRVDVRIPGGVNVTPLPDATPEVQAPYVPGPLAAAPTLIGTISAALGALHERLDEGIFGGALGNLAMADGGIVTRPVRAVIGEAGPEAVIPLDQWRGAGGGIGTVIINVTGFADGREAGAAAADAFRRQLGLQRRLPFGVA